MPTSWQSWRTQKVPLQRSKKILLILTNTCPVRLESHAWPAGQAANGPQQRRPQPGTAAHANGERVRATHGRAASSGRTGILPHWLVCLGQSSSVLPPAPLCRSACWDADRPWPAASANTLFLQPALSASEWRSATPRPRCQPRSRVTAVPFAIALCPAALSFGDWRPATFTGYQRGACASILLPSCTPLYAPQAQACLSLGPRNSPSA
jgi:hypothetical protein